MCIFYVAGVVILMLAAAMLLIKPRSLLAWEKKAFGIDRTRIISDMDRWGRHARSAQTFAGVLLLGVAILAFCLPTIVARRKADREAAARRSMNSGISEADRIRWRIEELERRLETPHATWPQERPRLQAELEELRRKLADVTPPKKPGE